MKLDQSHAKALLASIRGLKVAVLGDLMLDEYLFGEVSRISPEAPVPIVRIVREKAVLGGAANVAANLKALGAEPLLIGSLQKDVAGERLMELLMNWGISTTGLVLDPSRPTIIKTRVIGQTQQMLRIDREEPRSLDETALRELVGQLRKCLPETAALIISDYAKGIIGPQVMDEVRELCPPSTQCAPHPSSAA